MAKLRALAVKPAGRATISPEPKLRCESAGKLHQQFNPGYEVRNQNEPTPANPISQHKQFKGHSTSVAHPGIPK